MPLSVVLSLGTTWKMTGSRCRRVCVCVFNPPPMNLSHFCLFHRFQPAVLLAKALCTRRIFYFFRSLCQKGARDVTNGAEDSVCPFLFFFLPSPPHFSLCLGSKHSSIRCFFFFLGACASRLFFCCCSDGELLKCHELSGSLSFILKETVGMRS